MSIFSVSFRIVSDATYTHRYSSVVEAIKNTCIPLQYWDESTSYYIIEAEGSAQTVADSIDIKSLFATRDLLVVVNLSAKGYAVKGTYKDPDLKKLLDRM